MRIAITEKKGLKLVLTDEREWEIFELLVVDAEGRGEGWLAKRLAVLMDDEDYDEFVAPGLTEQFQTDLKKVREELRRAFEEWQQSRPQKENEQHEEPNFDSIQDDSEEEITYGEVLIDKENGFTWYSVLNQARLALEGKWKLAALEQEEDFGSLENIEQERIAAYLRNGFYTRIQGVLLEHSLDL